MYIDCHFNRQPRLFPEISDVEKITEDKSWRVRRGISNDEIAIALEGDLEGYFKVKLAFSNIMMYIT